MKKKDEITSLLVVRGLVWLDRFQSLVGFACSLLSNERQNTNKPIKKQKTVSSAIEY